MRWFWIDRFEKFIRCRSATAVKTVTLAEEHLHDHVPGAALMPNTLVLEGLAQAAGLLVADAVDYRRQVVLAKVATSEFFFDVVPGDVLRYEVEILELGESGSLVKATSTVAGRPQAAAELVFGHLEEGVAVPKLMSRPELLCWLDNLRIFDVAVEEDGTPVHRERI